MTAQPGRPATKTPIPVWNLYGESQTFPDVLHIETILHRAAGLDWRIAPHRHTHLHQFFLIECGSVQIRLDGAMTAAQPPFLLSVPPGVVHGFAFAAGTQGWVLTVPLQTLPDLLEPALSRQTALSEAAVLPVTSAMTDLFNEIYQEHAALNLARATLLRAYATQVACRVLRDLDQRPRRQTNTPDPRFARFQALMVQHLRDGWRLRDYAQTIGVSERHLSRLSHAATGHPAAELIASALMREACRMLAYTRAPVASIGYDLGFDDPSYFSRAFRRVVGQSPAAYRAGFDRD